ncbi:hypothetical protein B0H67DRAFT_265084 [Lasiosphaeris hirsuta]|uniref:Uncharacterized protein n=1 Tax=Lasiosphaeris hirsuta TaxID=260670 RepID=A0AA40A7M2_9PEZI|nr:hypothetical protein B0H67DRAFT_265084 [Lasiosphaeris hirsuta]
MPPFAMCPMQMLSMGRRLISWPISLDAMPDTAQAKPTHPWVKLFAWNWNWLPRTWRVARSLHRGAHALGPSTPPPRPSTAPLQRSNLRGLACHSWTLPLSRTRTP